MCACACARYVGVCLHLPPLNRSAPNLPSTCMAAVGVGPGVAVADVAIAHHARRAHHELRSPHALHVVHAMCTRIGSLLVLLLKLADLLQGCHVALFFESPCRHF